MSLEHPYLFIILIVPFIFFVYLVLTNKEGVERVFSQKVLEKIKVEGSGLNNKARNIILFLSAFFMIVAIAHPFIDKGKVKVNLSGLNIVLALDISGSMRTKDTYPNRFEFAKMKIKELFNELPEEEVMLITFAKDVFLVSPFTRDKEMLKNIIDGIGKDYIQQSTNFETLAKALAKILQKKDPKIAIIISDGGEAKSDLKKFKEIVKKNGIIVYAILIGSKEGGVVLDKNNKAIVKNSKVVVSKLNMELANIAKESGGDYIIAKYGNKDIKKLVNKLHSDFVDLISTKSIKVNQKIELFYYPLLLAFIFFFSALISIPEFKKEVK